MVYLCERRSFQGTGVVFIDGKKAYQTQSVPSEGMGIHGLGIKGLGVRGLGFSSWIKNIGSKVVSGSKRLLPAALAAAKDIGKDLVAEHGDKVIAAAAKKVGEWAPSAVAPFASNAVKSAGKKAMAAVTADIKPLPPGKKMIANIVGDAARDVLKEALAQRGSGPLNAINNQFVN